MKIGTFASIVTPICSPQLILDLGKGVEAAGLDSLWLGEHVVLFDEMEVGYPGTPDGKLPIPEGAGLPDTVVTFSYLASATSKIRFGTGITLIPQRNLIYTANEFATLDYLSGGRVDLGVGVGWCKEEVIACGHDFDTRGARCDEMLDAMIKLWTQREVTYEGKHIQLNAAKLDPKPVQSPHIPLIIGGYSAAAMRRTAQFGQGWLGFGTNPEQTAAAMQGIDAALDAAGRSREGFEIIVMPADATADTVKEFQDIGVDRLVPMLVANSADTMNKRIDELAALADAI
jgi:probable F420-dependent oxidoreductase